MLLSLLLATSALFSQQPTTSQKNNELTWVRLMEDSNVNFFVNNGKTTLNISKLITGVYMVKIRNKEEKTIVKIIKE